MPIYEYECDACGHRHEAIQKFSDAPLKSCPACAAPRLKKLVSAAAFHLKGTGWYETDFKGGKKPDEAAAADKGDGKDTGKESGKDLGKDAGKESAKSSAAASDKGAAKAATAAAQKPGRNPNKTAAAD